MTAKEFRRAALGFPGTTEIAPHGAPEFRGRTRCFASLGGDRAAVKLTPADQATYLSAEPNVFFLAKGDRGKKGWTIVELAEAKSETLRVAITQAWRNVATKQLLREYDGE